MTLRDALVSHLAVLVGVHVLQVLLDLLLLDGEDVEPQERRHEPRRRLHVGVEVDRADDLAPHLVEVRTHPLLALHVPVEWWREERGEEEEAEAGAVRGPR